MSITQKASTVALLFLLAAAPAFARMGQSAGNGSLSMESKDPVKTYQSVLEAAGRQGAVVTSYNTQKNSQTGQTQISAQFHVDREKVAAFMAEVAAMGVVKSQNYYEQPARNEPAVSYVEQLASLDREIAALSPVAARVPTILGYAVQQRQSLASQAQYTAAVVNQDKATLSLTVMEGGLDAVSPGARDAKKGVPLPWALFAAVLSAFFASWMGFLLGRLRFPGPEPK